MELAPFLLHACFARHIATAVSLPSGMFSGCNIYLLIGENFYPRFSTGRRTA